MRSIFFISSNDWVNWGGSEYLWCLTAQAFARNGFKVEASVNDKSIMPAPVQTLRQLGATVHFRRLIKLTANQIRLNRLLPARFQHKEKSTANDIFRNKADLVVISQAGNQDGLGWMEYCARHAIPFVTISQAVNEYYTWPDDKMAQRYEKAYLAARCNFFVSKANLKTTQLQIGQPLPNARVVWNPFNVPYHNAIPYPHVPGGFTLACVARYDPNAKGQDILLEVLADAKWRARPLAINLYGQGNNAGLLQKLVKFFGVQRVTLQGYMATPEIWARNQALVLPSRYEGLPLSLVEAMLCRRTAIVTNVSGNGEVMTDDENGFLAKGTAPELLDEALERAWQRREEWEQLGLKARAHITSLVPEDPVGEFYRELVKFL
jgi:glycosyltransferase involved in cell wall biosynthesis